MVATAGRLSSARSRHAWRSWIFPSRLFRCRRRRRAQTCGAHIRLDQHDAYPARTHPQFCAGRFGQEYRCTLSAFIINPRGRPATPLLGSAALIVSPHKAGNDHGPPSRSSCATVPRLRKSVATLSARRARPSRSCRPWARCMTAISRWCARPSKRAEPGRRLDLRQSRRNSRRTRTSRSLSAHLRDATWRRCRGLKVDLVWAPTGDGDVSGRLFDPRSRPTARPRPDWRTPSARISSAASRPSSPSCSCRSRPISRCSARRTTSSSRW